MSKGADRGGDGKREEEIEEALRGRLRLVIGEAGALIGLDEGVDLGTGRGSHEVDADDGDLDGVGRGDRRLGELRVQLAGDVVDGAAGVEVGGLTGLQLDARGQDIAQLVAFEADAALGLGVDGNARLSAGCGLAAAALRLDQAADVGPVLDRKSVV
mgnify:CR=1 FL=1